MEEKNHISRLPKDTLVEIANLLDQKSFLQFMQTQKLFKEIGNEVKSKMARLHDYNGLGKDAIILINICKGGNLDELRDYLKLPPDSDFSSLTPEQKKTATEAIANVFNTTDNNQWSALYWLIYCSHTPVLNYLFDLANQLINTPESLEVAIEQLKIVITFHRNDEAIVLAKNLNLILVDKIDYLKSEVRKEIMVTAGKAQNATILAQLDSEKLFGMSDLFKNASKSVLTTHLKQKSVAMIKYYIESKGGSVCSAQEAHELKQPSLLYNAILCYAQEKFPSPERKEIIMLLLMSGAKIVKVPDATGKLCEYNSDECLTAKDIAMSLNNVLSNNLYKIPEQRFNAIQGWVKAAFFLRKAEQEIETTQNCWFFKSLPMTNFRAALAASPEYFGDYMVRILEKTLAPHKLYESKTVAQLLQLDGTDNIKNAKFNKLKNKLTADGSSNLFGIRFWPFQSSQSNEAQSETSHSLKYI